MKIEKYLHERFIILIIFLFVTVLTQSQNAFILKGTLLTSNESSKSDIKIKIADSDIETLTNDSGSFTLNFKDNSIEKKLLFYIDKNNPVTIKFENKATQTINIGSYSIFLTIEEIDNAPIDSDGDGIPDKDDPCPYIAGSGCADTDGDGVSDADDACPDLAGKPENRGCPAEEVIVDSAPPNHNKLISFPIPYPEPSDTYNIPWNRIKIQGSKTFEKVNNKLISALNKCGYLKRSYYYIPHGFALVTKIEKINSNGTSQKEPQRWSIKVDKPNSFTEYLRSLINAPKGYFRVIVFLVTDIDLTTSGKEMDRDKAINYADKGYTALPNPIKKMSFNNNHKVTALVYEYEKKQGVDPILLKELSAEKHITNSGIAEALK